MALRTEARTGIVILVAAIAATATDYPATHVHLRKGDTGTLAIDAQGVRFEGKHAFTWSWDHLQKVTLAPDRLTVITYKDRKWQAGRDEAESFAGDFTESAALLRERLPRRFIAEIAQEPPSPPEATLPAKRLASRNAGHEGTLIFAADRIVFRSDSKTGSHTWMLNEVENVSSSDPLQLTISSLGVDDRLQLKTSLPEPLYNQLWRRLNTRRTQP